MKAEATTSFIFLTAGTSMAWLLLQGRGAFTHITVAAPIVGFLLAAGLVFWRPRIGYGMGLLSGLWALHWFWNIEFGYFPALNSWIAFNLPPDNAHLAPDIYLAKLRILFGVMAVVTILCSAMRLLPAKWKLRGNPVRETTWPALVACLFVIGAWYLTSASPYRIPLIVDGVPPELVLLHVQKRGSQFHETSVTAYRDREFYVEQDDRRLFQYRFADRRSSGILPDEIAARAQATARSSQLLDMRTQPAVPLRARNAEGWYVRMGREKVLAFTTEYGTPPPSDIVALFHDLQALPRNQAQVRTFSDICMGFCYDPLAGLGFVAMNERCRDNNGTRCK
jgi:hypothetical protein